jgi:hypothetical protein
VIEPSRRKKFHNVPFSESRLAHHHAERQYPLDSTAGGNRLSSGVHVAFGSIALKKSLVIIRES